MKGNFVSYDESTGKVLIEADLDFFDPESIENYPSGEGDSIDEREFLAAAVRAEYYSRNLILDPLRDKSDEYYYLIVPEQQRHRMNIKPGRPVDFDLVEEGSREVKSMRF